MTAKLPKTLDLGMGNLGGRTHFYARNVQRNGDWATVGYIVGEVSDNAEMFIGAYGEFKTPAYIEQMKQHLLSINPTLTFAHDQPNGAFVSADQVLSACEKQFDLMSFEIEMIRENDEKLHEIYLAAKPKKLDRLPPQYTYESPNSMYPVYQVFRAVTDIIHGE